MLWLYLQISESSSASVSAVLSPHVAILGSAFENMARIFIYVEGEPVILADDALDAFILVYQMYYCLWLHFPKCATSCYKFLQHHIFNHEDGILPAKLVRLLSQTV
jgi:hypothetical protein